MSMPTRWYVLVCPWCQEDDGELVEQAIPFASPEDREEWATAHTQATGHDRFIRRLDTDPDRAVINRIIAGPEKQD